MALSHFLCCVWSNSLVQPTSLYSSVNSGKKALISFLPPRLGPQRVYEKPSSEANAQHQVPSVARRAIVSSVYVSKPCCLSKKRGEKTIVLPGLSQMAQILPDNLQFVCLGGTVQRVRHFRLCASRKSVDWKVNMAARRPPTTMTALCDPTVFTRCRDKILRVCIVSEVYRNASHKCQGFSVQLLVDRDKNWCLNRRINPQSARTQTRLHETSQRPFFHSQAQFHIRLPS